MVKKKGLVCHEKGPQADVKKISGGAFDGDDCWVRWCCFCCSASCCFANLIVPFRWGRCGGLRIWQSFFKNNFFPWGFKDD